jgi:hypothetical protein
MNFFIKVCVMSCLFCVNDSFATDLPQTRQQKNTYYSCDEICSIVDQQFNELIDLPTTLCHLRTQTILTLYILLQGALDAESYNAFENDGIKPLQKNIRPFLARFAQDLYEVELITKRITTQYDITYSSNRRVCELLFDITLAFESFFILPDDYYEQLKTIECNLTNSAGPGVRNTEHTIVVLLRINCFYIMSFLNVLSKFPQIPSFNISDDQLCKYMNPFLNDFKELASFDSADSDLDKKICYMRGFSAFMKLKNKKGHKSMILKNKKKLRFDGEYKKQEKKLLVKMGFKDLKALQENYSDNPDAFIEKIRTLPEDLRVFAWFVLSYNSFAYKAVLNNLIMEFYLENLDFEDSYLRDLYSVFSQLMRSSGPIIPFYSIIKNNLLCMNSYL